MCWLDGTGADVIRMLRIRDSRIGAKVMRTSAASPTQVYVSLFVNSRISIFCLFVLSTQ